MSRTEIRGTQIRDESILIDDLAAYAPEAGTGLNLAVSAGRIRSDNTVMDNTQQTVLLTDGATNYVEIDTAGVASANTTGFTSGRIPIATAVTAGGMITVVTDKRTWVLASGGGGGGLTNATVVQFQRTGADGTGTQSIVLGFQPKAVYVIAHNSLLVGSSIQGSWGMATPDGVNMCLWTNQNGPNRIDPTKAIVVTFDSELSYPPGTDFLRATIQFPPTGIDVVWEFAGNPVNYTAQVILLAVR